MVHYLHESVSALQVLCCRDLHRPAVSSPARGPLQGPQAGQRDARPGGTHQDHRLRALQGLHLHAQEWFLSPLFRLV